MAELRSRDQRPSQASDAADQSSQFLAGGGEMGALMRAKDWSNTPLGPPSGWPQPLRTTVGILLNSRYPMFIAWGPQLAFIYNDGYRPIFGDKHPHALGQPFAEAWSEIWDEIRPLVDRALSGEPTFSEDLQLFMERRGYPEEVYFTFSYSPIRDEAGGIGGMFCACIETTANVLSARRLRTLSDLAAAAAAAQVKNVDETQALCLQALEGNRADIPFALLYRVEGSDARLFGATGVAGGSPVAPERLSSQDAAWPLAAMAAANATLIHDLTARFAAVPRSLWDDPVQTAVILPVPTRGEGELPSALVLGVNPRRAYDAEYKVFFDRIAGAVATATANAQAFEAERKRAEMLAEIDRVKTAFFSNVSHEFRTPLTLMLGPLEEMKREFGRSSGSLSTPQYQQVDLIHRNGLRLLKLVNTLLDFSRIEASRVQAVYEPTDLAAYTADLASVFRSAVEKAGLKLVIDCPPLPEPAYIDREMWEKIVLNLISNAFKFTFDGEIEVTLASSGTHFELAVRDTGTGIPADEVPRLFERFHRVAGARGRTHEGSGIGLALVQELVRLHGGSVSVESVYGKGSTFRVFIPLGHGHLPQQHIGAARTQGSTALGATPFVEDALRWLSDGGSDHERVIEDTAVPDEAARHEGERPRILLADDNADMRQYLRRLLGARYEVEAVADGEAALAAVEKRVPDLVLSDVMMPRLDGLALLARLRADPRTSILPVILLSARADEDARMEGLAATADGYLTKPFSARELLAHVAMTIETAKLRHESESRIAAELADTKLLQRISAEMIHEENVEALYETIMDAAVGIMRSNYASMQMLYPGRGEPGSGGELRLLAFRGFNPQAAKFWEWVRADSHSTCAQALRTGKRAIAPDVTKCEYMSGSEDLATCLQTGIRAVQTTPLISRSGKVVGMISTHWNRPHEPSERDLRLLDILARQAADLIERKQVEQALRESEERFRHMADNAPVMVWVTEPDARCSYLGKSWYDFTGQTPETGLGFGWFDAVHPEDRASAQATFVAANAKHEAFRLEYRVRRKDGEYRWAIDAAAPRFGPTGEFLGYVGSVIDITERKQAERTQALLVAELNHRVKNTLASVQAIVQHTLRRTRDPAEFVTSFAGRIQSLSRVHTLLSNTTWKGADLRDLIRDQLLAGAVDETRITAWGPPVRLESQVALHMALMLHELGTNAIKYGALSTAKGVVTISWTVDGATLRMHWMERGGPIVAAPTTRGFGRTLIEQSAKGEGGEARMSVEAEGVVWNIALPLPQPVETYRSAKSSVAEFVGSAPSEVVPAAGRAHARLGGKRFLVVEDEPLVALDVIAALEDAGAEVVGPTGTTKEALSIIESTSLDAALLDANLRGQPVDDIAAALTRRNVPFLFVTGYGPESLPRAFAKAAMLAKPFSHQQLVQAAVPLVRQPAHVLRLRD